MKLSLAAVLLSLTTSAFANNVIINGTRFIYPADSKEITVQFNNQGDKPAVMQTWMDVGDPNESPENITTPFTITPPIAKIEGKAGQTVRIRAVNKAGIPTDRESVWWLNTLEIPPTVKVDGQEDTNKLQLAIRSRFKFFYRPDGLGEVSSAPEQLVLTAKGNELNVENPSPFFITITGVNKANGSKANKETVMVNPKGHAVMKLNSPISKGEALNIITINDYGSDAKYNLTAK